MTAAKTRQRCPFPVLRRTYLKTNGHPDGHSLQSLLSSHIHRYDHRPMRWQLQTDGRLVVLGLFLSLITSTAAARNRDDAFIGYKEKAFFATKAGERIVLTTKFGQIKIRPLYESAPKTAELAVDLARTGICPECNFYRNEAVPLTWGENNFWGPPYCLLQGSLASLPEEPPFEGHTVVKRGHVCAIPNCKEFFIATADHPEWGTAHTVWGKVEDMSVVDSLLLNPYNNFTHPEFGTVMRMLVEPIPFSISAESQATAV